MDMRSVVTEKFNAQLGTDLKGLNKIVDFYKHLQAEKDEMEKSLSMASSEAPSKVKAVLEKINIIVDEIQQFQSSCSSLYSEIEEVMREGVKNSQLQDTVDKIDELEKSLAYFNILKYIEDISNNLETSLSVNDDESTITLYTNLKEISYQLQSSSCHQLINYVQETLHYWHNLIKKKLTVEYNDILKALKWPLCGTDLNALHTPTPETVMRFKIITEYLFYLQLPENNKKPMVTSSLLINFAPLSLPISLLLQPLRKRFIYHFKGTKRTNRQDKPEWFFTQILKWIKDHIDWVEQNVQPIANATGFNDIDVKVEFMRGLVQLAVEKLHSELPIAQYDDGLFAHYVDEALGFEKELREILLYPEDQPSTLSVLTQAQIFVKWISIEKKYATEKMDAILSSNTAWDKLSEIDDEDMKVTECADAFLTLLTTISDRYKHLPQPGHRLQFLELQLELIDDWRVRLLQLLHENYENPLTSFMPCILNTLNYVINVLDEWGLTVHFLQLYLFKKQFEAAEIATDAGGDVKAIEEIEGNVFNESITLLQTLKKKFIAEISNSITLDVKARSRPYKTDKWFAMQSGKNLASLSVTPSGCLMFQELASRLHVLHNALALPLFHQAVTNIANQLDQFLIEEVVLVNHFNNGGSEQLQHDIFRNLFPLFNLYVNKPETCFPLIREACILLNILIGSAILLLEALETSDDSTSTEILIDVGVSKISPDIAVKVLQSRIDICT